MAAQAYHLPQVDLSTLHTVLPSLGGAPLRRHSMGVACFLRAGLPRMTGYQPSLPGPPLKGPAKSGVIQPP